MYTTSCPLHHLQFLKPLKLPSLSVNLSCLTHWSCLRTVIALAIEHPSRTTLRRPMHPRLIAPAITPTPLPSASSAPSPIRAVACHVCACLAPLAQLASRSSAALGATSALSLPTMTCSCSSGTLGAAAWSCFWISSNSSTRSLRLHHTHGQHPAQEQEREDQGDLSLVDRAVSGAARAPICTAALKWVGIDDRTCFSCGTLAQGILPLQVVLMCRGDVVLVHGIDHPLVARLGQAQRRGHHAADEFHACTQRVNLEGARPTRWEMGVPWFPHRQRCRRGRAKCRPRTVEAADASPDHLLHDATHGLAVVHHVPTRLAVGCIKQKSNTRSRWVKI